MHGMVLPQNKDAEIILKLILWEEVINFTG